MAYEFSLRSYFSIHRIYTRMPLGTFDAIVEVRKSLHRQALCLKEEYIKSFALDDVSAPSSLCFLNTDLRRVFTKNGETSPALDNVSFVFCHATTFDDGTMLELAGLAEKVRNMWPF